MISLNNPSDFYDKLSQEVRPKDVEHFFIQAVNLYPRKYKTYKKLAKICNIVVSLPSPFSFLKNVMNSWNIPVTQYRIFNALFSTILDDNVLDLKRKITDYKNEFQSHHDHILSLCARLGSVKCFRFLTMNCFSLSDLSFTEAIKSGNYEIIEIYINEKFIPDYSGIITAVESFNNQFVKWAVDEYDIKLDYDILKAAVFNYNYKAFFIDDLLFCKFFTNHNLPNAISICLNLAVQNYDIYLTEFLLTLKDVDINVTDSNICSILPVKCYMLFIHNTPLYYALLNAPETGYYIAELLVKQGADIFEFNNIMKLIFTRNLDSILQLHFRNAASNKLEIRHIILCHSQSTENSPNYLSKCDKVLIENIPLSKENLNNLFCHFSGIIRNPNILLYLYQKGADIDDAFNVPCSFNNMSIINMSKNCY